MDEHRYAACDLGAESGRVMLGRLTADGRLTLEEVHRFPSPVVRLPPGPSLRWDVVAIYGALTDGLRKAARGAGGPVAGVSVDSWGVDYAVVGGGQPLLWPPHHYRDGRTADAYARLRQDPGEAYIFERTGIQFMPINTLYQLAADVAVSGPVLDRADALLTIADYFNALLSGVARVDESLASTTQLFDPRSRTWSAELIDRCGLPRHLFPQVVPPGTVLGPVRPDVAADLGFAGPTPAVVTTCSHDTAAAVAAVPAEGDGDWAFLSSGTWSLLGVERPSPLITDAVRRANFTNEAGFGGTTRLLKNLVGLWVLQELRRAWAADGTPLEYAPLMDAARAADPFRSLIDLRDGRFGTPGQMPQKVAGFCDQTGQPAPETPGQFARCVLESLALLYRDTVAELERLTGRRVGRIHVVGGGSRSELLNQFTADATGCEVVAGPVEASAVGNVLVQAIALGHLPSLAAARAVVRRSFPLTTFRPSNEPAWATASHLGVRTSLSTRIPPSG